MTPDYTSLIVNDWLLHILAGILLVAFAFLLGQRRSEKVSMSTKECATAREACRELLTTKQEGDEKVHDQKLFRIEEKIGSLEDKVDGICSSITSLRGMVVDYFRSQGYEDRRDINPKRYDGTGGESKGVTPV